MITVRTAYPPSPEPDYARRHRRCRRAVEVAGSSPAARTIYIQTATKVFPLSDFAYTYVLCCADEDFYIGSTDDLRRRMKQHHGGNVPSTASRRPVELVYYEASLSLDAARKREKQLKTGYGHKYLKNRITLPSHLPAVPASENRQ